MRGFNMWRANTSNLLHEASEREEETPGHSYRRISEAYSQHICGILAHYSSSDYQVIETRISDIFSQSVELDKQFSKQVASLRWTTISAPKSTNTRAFDPKIMELERGETRASHEQTITLVLSPSLVKWGKSSGEDFNLSVALLKMEVTLQSPPNDSARASSTTARGWIRGF